MILKPSKASPSLFYGKKPGWVKQINSVWTLLKQLEKWYIDVQITRYLFTLNRL